MGRESGSGGSSEEAADEEALSNQGGVITRFGQWGECGQTESVIRRELHQLVSTAHFFNTMLDAMPNTARASAIMRW